MTDLTGQLLGSYTLGARESAGSVDVYRARNTANGQEVIIKVSELPEARRVDLETRFRAEAQRLMRLKYPNILRILDYGQQDNLLYVAMELPQGVPLATQATGKPLPLNQIESWVWHIGSILDDIHAMGGVHRDLTLQNVLIDAQGHLFLADFGLGSLISRETVILPQGGIVTGTEEYMAPEVWTTGAHDLRTAVYALGILAYRLIGGQYPFMAETRIQMQYMHVQVPPPSLRSVRSDVPEAVDAVVRKALFKYPEGRFQSGREFAYAFMDALRGVSTLNTAPAPEAGSDNASAQFWPEPVVVKDRPVREDWKRRQWIFLILAPVAILVLIVMLPIFQPSTIPSASVNSKPRAWAATPTYTLVAGAFDINAAADFQSPDGIVHIKLPTTGWLFTILPGGTYDFEYGEWGLFLAQLQVKIQRLGQVSAILGVDPIVTLDPTLTDRRYRYVTRHEIIAQFQALARDRDGMAMIPSEIRDARIGDYGADEITLYERSAGGETFYRLTIVPDHPELAIIASLHIEASIRSRAEKDLLRIFNSLVVNPFADPPTSTPMPTRTPTLLPMTYTQTAILKPVIDASLTAEASRTPR